MRNSAGRTATELVAAGVILVAALVPVTASAGTREEAIAYFEAAFAGQCQPFSETTGLFDGDEEAMPHRYEVSYVPSWAEAGSPPEQAVLYGFFCSSGAYNIQSVFLRDWGEFFEPLSFARPTFDIENEGEDYDSPVRSIKVTGYESSVTVTNAQFDPQSRTLTARAFWRGLGDAYDEGVWVFQDDAFVLAHYVVDADYDGETEPQLELDYARQEP